MTSNLIYIVFALGIMTYVMVRIYAPWPEKHQNFFWLVCFAPMLISYMSNIPSDITNLMILPFFGALACSEFMRQKLKPLKQHFINTLYGNNIQNAKTTTKNKTNKKPQK